MLPFPFCKEQKICCSHLLGHIQSDTSFPITFTIIPMSFELQPQGFDMQHILWRTQSKQISCSEQYSCKFNNALRSSISLCLFIFFTSHICTAIRAKVSFIIGCESNIVVFIKAVMSMRFMANRTFFSVIYPVL